MKRILLLFALLLSLPTLAQMNNERLETLLTEKVDSIDGVSGRWQLVYNEVPMMVITDETNDRMRIIAPIVEVDKLNEDILLDCLAANFHTALDVKYALSNNIMWSVFIHPLSPLSDEELKSAVDQVYYAAVNFGTSYTSTPLLFGGGNGEEEPVEEKKPELKLKKT
ncbi:MAG: YbjN domain-containing protein [Flavobacteriaceae bacterium]|nr:YbjN domain-containing protein [Flavobacteriaceae bacterium]